MKSVSNSSALNNPYLLTGWRNDSAKVDDAGRAKLVAKLEENESPFSAESLNKTPAKVFARAVEGLRSIEK